MTRAAHGYSGTPLPRKLGIHDDSRTLLVGAPGEFRLDTRHHRRASGTGYDVQLVFCADAPTLRRRWPGAVRRSTERGAVWIAWPKKASGLQSRCVQSTRRGRR